MEIIDDGDVFFLKLYDMIDNAKTCCWIITYDMGHGAVADEVLRRLIKASERGVDVLLMVDWLNYYPNPELIKELENKGGVVRVINPM